MAMIMLNNLTYAMLESGISKTQLPVDPVSGQKIVQRFCAHAWVTSGGEPFIRAVASYRTCKRCGVLQRAVHCSLSGQVAWETMRERTCLELQHLQVVRQPSSMLEGLAHSFGLRRRRMSDRNKYQQVLRRWPDGSWRKHSQDAVY